MTNFLKSTMTDHKIEDQYTREPYVVKFTTFRTIIDGKVVEEIKPGDIIYPIVMNDEE